MVEQQGKRLLVQAAAFLFEMNAYGEGKTALLGWTSGQLEKYWVRQGGTEQEPTGWGETDTLWEAKGLLLARNKSQAWERKDFLKAWKESMEFVHPEHAKLFE